MQMNQNYVPLWEISIGSTDILFLKYYACVVLWLIVIGFAYSAWFAYPTSTRSKHTYQNSKHDTGLQRNFNKGGDIYLTTLNNMQRNSTSGPTESPSDYDQKI
jgi:hypothetical protein